MGEFVLTGLPANFTSQVLEISILMDVDANGVIGVQAEEPRSGAKAAITINPQNRKNLLNELQVFHGWTFFVDPLTAADISRHIEFVESNPDFRAVRAADRKADDPLYMVRGKSRKSFESRAVLVER